MRVGDRSELARWLWSCGVIGAQPAPSQVSDRPLYRAFHTGSATGAQQLANRLRAACLIKDADDRWLRLDVDVEPSSLRVQGLDIPVWTILAFRTHQLLPNTEPRIKRVFRGDG